ncbi:MAG: UDP-3-O-(3-hydroxymyristoyl)glucosamine N-acyltransferase [Halothiobacillus sp.]|nr:UDP-3-O-(3-hydroxymyristoyl)glucosamine N-acyltransferase [Halothiobacillus sp.]
MPAIPADAIRVADVAARLGASVRGDAGRLIRGVASLASATISDLAYFSGNRRGIQPGKTSAGVVLCRVKDQEALPSSSVLILVSNPQSAFVDVLEWLFPRPEASKRVDPSASVHPDAHLADDVTVGPYAVIGSGCQIGSGARIGPGCILGEGVSIGSDTELIARVTVMNHCVIGARCVIQPGAVIGSDGFGLVNEHGKWRRVPQLGRVVIGDDVDIGANTTIDRGALDDTRIDDGAKLDNLIQIAHNVEIGAHSAIAGCAGLAGSSVVGKYCTLGGGVGLAGHLTLADDVHITGMSMVTRSIRQPGVYSAGTPLDTNENWHKNAARFKQLERIVHRVQALETDLNSLRKKDEENL